MAPAPPPRSPGIGSRPQAVIAAMALVALALGLFGVLTRHELRRALEAQARVELETIGMRAALELPGAMSAWDHASIEGIAESAFTNRQVSSVKITDDVGRSLALRLREDPALVESARRLALAAAPGTLRSAIPVTAGRERLGWACRTPVWSSGTPSRLLGYVTVAGTEDTSAKMTAALPRVALVAGGVCVLVAAPLAVWGASGLTGPIRRVARAATELAEGRTPERIEPRGPREARRLAEAFNAMSQSLSEAHARLEAANADLENQVRERTEELVAVNTLLEKQMLDKNDFLRSVSHDLGAPLRNIAGMASLVREEHAADLPEEAVRWLERITANVEIETGMLTQLVELSRAADRPERVADACVRETAVRLAQSLALDLRRERVELTVRPGLPTLRVDPADLWVLLQNLTDNALKYMGGSRQRRIEIAPVHRGGRACGFAVSDTGPGIPADEHPRLFRAFQRASTAGDRPGAGVGLAVVRGVVERWGAEIVLTSAPGEGTRFEILLPPHRVAGGATVTAPPSASAG